MAPALVFSGGDSGDLFLAMAAFLSSFDDPDGELVDECQNPCELEDLPPEMDSSLMLGSAMSCDAVQLPEASVAASSSGEPTAPDAELPITPCRPARPAPSSVVESEVKRIRLRQKTPPPSSSPRVVQAVVLPHAEEEPSASSSRAGGTSKQSSHKRFPDEKDWELLSRRQQYDIVYEGARIVYGKSLGVGSNGKRLHHKEIRKRWGELRKDLQCSFVRTFLDEAAAPEYVKLFCDDIFGQKHKAGDTKRNLGKSVMMTFNGDWGLRSNDAWIDTTGMTQNAAIAKLRDDIDVRTLWDDFLIFAGQVQEQFMANDRSCCLELSTSTFATDHIARVHFHLWIRSNQKLFLRKSEALKFRDVRGENAACFGGVMKSTRNTSFQGALYCSSLKIGSIFSFSTREMFSGYLVQPTWLLNLLQADKISIADARRAILRTCQNVQKHLQDIDVIEQERSREQVEAIQRAAQQALSVRRRPFITIPLVERWREQYSNHEFRYRFLVLDGPSRLGKTQFGLSLTPSNCEYLELNCAGGGPIDFRSFKFGRHGLILFDEAEPQQILAQRKAFQAGPGDVQMGQSATSIFCYTVVLYQVRMVVSSNRWELMLSTLNKADHDWIVENSYFVKVTETLFLPEDKS